MMTHMNAEVNDRLPVAMVSPLKGLKHLNKSDGGISKKRLKIANRIFFPTQWRFRSKVGGHIMVSGKFSIKIQNCILRFGSFRLSNSKCFLLKHSVYSSISTLFQLQDCYLQWLHFRLLQN